MLIYCNQCKKNVGEFHVDDRGKVVFDSEDGILAVRKRMDGNWGFQCMCGNDSRIAQQEKGLIGKEKRYASKRPSIEIVNIVLDKVRKNPTRLKKSKGMIEIDNFKHSEG